MQKNIVKETKTEYTKAMSDIIEAKSDLFFRYVFSKKENEPQLVALINAIFEDSNSPAITSATVLNPFNIRTFKNGKDSILDISAQSDDKRIINIEMQLSGNENYIKRSLYYWAKSYSSQLKKGTIYTKLHPVIGVNILDFNLQTTKQKAHSVFYITEKTDSSIALTQDFELHFLELKKFLQDKKSVASVLGTWLEYFANATEDTDMTYVLDANPLIQKVDEDFRDFAGTDDYRQCYENQLKAWRDSEYLKQGWIDEARQEGLNQGIEQGIEKGIEKGAYEKAREMALNFKRDGISLEIISRNTGIPLSEIEKL